MPIDEITAEAWGARATACELLAMGFRYPTLEMAQAVCEGEFADAACELAVALKLPSVEGAPCFSGLRCEDGRDSEALLRALRAEYTRLFIGAPAPKVDPYECVWAARAKGVKPLLFIGPAAMEVERFCKKCGIGHSEGSNEPFDHIAAELELLEYLAALCAGIAEYPEGFAEMAFPGGSPAQAYALFAVGHLGAWADEFAESVIEEAEEPFYAGLSHMLSAFASQRFGIGGSR